MDLKLMPRFLPYALIAIITITSSLWFRRSRRSRGNPERSINSEEGEAEASSPPSPSPPFVREDIGFKYDVFLSFRGPDTRKGFTGHLYEALKGKGIDTFIDNEKLKKGQKVAAELFECIERSKIFVPIFSKGYADSEWCLKEMAKMVECKRLIVPVFIDVEPRDVRHQIGLFAPAFARHRKNKKIDKEEVSQWSDALRKAGELSGYTLADTEGNEAKLVRLIVKRILNEVNKTSLLVAKHPVGLDSRIADVKEMLNVDANNVRVVGIHGMGGIGKTTLAKAVYNQIYTRFDASSFIANVREAAKQSTGLVSLQEKLLRDFFNDENVNVSSIDQGIELIQKRICSKKVLLVLDDVDHESQLDALAGSRDWFFTGSRIIITTRDKHALGAKSVKLYETKELNGTQSLELFSWHAFGKKDPDPKFVELSKAVASAGAGLPLALTIFGSLFFDLETVEEWREKLQKLQEDQDKDIHVRLKISFDALDEKEKKVFLDIACFFLEEKNIELPLLMWEGCKFFPNTTIKVLRHKSLININGDTGKFEMHDLIRDMGRKIVQDSGSRLWKDDEKLDVLQTKKGTKNIEAIQLNSGTYWAPMYVEAEPFVAMSELRMLRLGENVQLKGEFEHFPKKLRWLQWCIKEDLDSLPDSLHLENIVVLDLSRSSITQLWNPQGLESTKVFGKLKVLKLSECVKLTYCPDFTRMPHLEKLNFAGCQKMSELDPSIGLLKSLTHFSLLGCGSLKTLPQEIWQLTSLEELELSGCIGITTLPSQMEDPKLLKPVLLGKLKLLDFSGCFNLTSCPDFTSMPHLQKLIFFSCKNMSELHPSIGLLKSLIELNLGDCFNLTSCPDFTSMPHLQKLNFESCKKMSELHPSIGLLKSLIELNLGDCQSLKELPPENWQLTSLERLDLNDCAKITTLPSQLGNSKALARLSLQSCKSLMELPEAVCQLTSLKALDLSSCDQLEIIRDVSSLKGLQKLNLSYCNKLVNVFGIQDLDKLEELELRHCDNLIRCSLFSSNMTHLRTLDFGDCANMTELDPSIGHLKSLTDLNLYNCKSLKELPQEVSQLSSLTRLDLTGCHQITALPKSMSCLKQLKWLSLQRCSSLTEIPECICSFLNLEELDASHCQRIAILPNWIGKLKSLKQLDLSWTAIEELPHSIVSLENLEMLSFAHCGKLEDVPGIKQMKLLRILQLQGCRSLHDSFLERLQEADFQDLENFFIAGRSLIDGGWSYPQSLSFLLPKQFERGILYLHVDKSSLDNICSELDEWEDESLESEEDRNMDSNDSELAYKSIPSDEVKDSRPGRVVSIEITTGDAKFQFSALIKFGWYKTREPDKCHKISEGDEFRKLPTATFERDSELMKMAKQGEFKGNDDVQLRTMMTMRVSIDGCVLLHGDLFTYRTYSFRWSNPDPIEADDNFVIVKFGWKGPPALTDFNRLRKVRRIKQSWPWRM